MCYNQLNTYLLLIFYLINMVDSSLSHFNKSVNALKKLKISGYGKDFLRTWDKTEDEIRATATVAELVRDLYYAGISPRVFNQEIAVSIFRDNSTRTKYSFASATNILGLNVQDLDEKSSQIAHGETIMETANMLSFLTKVIGIRDDKFLGVGHNYQLEVAKSVDIGYEEGVLAQRPSVINLQCDEDHPTQSMSDFLQLIRYFGGINKLKGKKLAMSWAYSPSYGKPMSVPQGVIALLGRFGVDLTLAYPKGYELIPEIESYAAVQAKKSGGSFKITHNMEDAFTEADVVYPKSWAPYSVMKERTRLLKRSDKKGLDELEKQTLANNAKFKTWTCTEEMMKLTKSGKALYMHCLPADITGLNCKEGEVDASVFARYRKETYVEASYKPFVIASMILLTQYGVKTPEVLKQIIKRNQKLAL